MRRLRLTPSGLTEEQRSQKTGAMSKAIADATRMNPGVRIGCAKQLIDSIVTEPVRTHTHRHTHTHHIRTRTICQWVCILVARSKRVHTC